MVVKAIILISCFASLALIGVPAYAAGEKLGKDDFVSTSVASVFDKVGEYASGEKKIVERDVWATGEESESSSARSGRALSDPNITIRGNIPSDKKPVAETKTTP